ncbi:hypothetical protein FACS1894184_18950 [Clostridia bacterium]|nr:hypothetical protein FACS1894184_18950 [Clostridia bacterium]
MIVTAYTLSGHKTGTVQFTPSDSTVVNEQAQYTSRVTQFPIEDGTNINDHLIRDPEKFSIDGEIVGGMQTASLLTAMRNNRDVITYSGRMSMDSLVITSLTLKASAKNELGANFQAQLQRVQITSAQYVPTGATPLMSQQGGAAKKTGNKGEQMPGVSMIGDVPAGLAYKPTPSTGPLNNGGTAHNGLPSGGGGRNMD